MTKRSNRRRGSSKAGRPRKEGERYPGGQLKPPGPNEITIARRRELVGEKGDLTRATSPMDLALERGWITEKHHRTGAAVVSIYNAAKIGVQTRSGVANLEEAARSVDVNRDDFGTMPDAQVAAVWDATFNVTDAVDREKQAAIALVRWKRINAVLTPAQGREVFLVCVCNSWPHWIVQRHAGHFGTSWERARDLLITGLDEVSAALRPVTKPRARIEPVEAPRLPPTAVLEESTAYVNPTGELLFEVVRRTRKTWG